MPLAIAVDAPRPARAVVTWVRRSVARLLGVAFMLAAAAAALVPVYVLGYPVLYPWLHPDQPVQLHQPDNSLAIVGVVAALVCAVLGAKLIGGRRYVVLFARRFGHRDSTRAVSTAARRIGRRWRFVTLDDAQITPLDAGPAARGAAGALRGAAGVARLAIVAWTPLRRLLSVIEDLDRNGLLRKLRKWTSLASLGVFAIGYLSSFVQTGRMDGMDFDGAWSVAEVIAAVGIVGLLITVITPVAVVLVAWLARFVFALPVVLVTAALASMDGAQDRRAANLPTEEAVLAARKTVETNRNSIFSPRLAVYTVDSSIWQYAMTELADAASAVLVDVSEPTANIAWELELVARRHPGRWVVVGELDRLRHLDGNPPDEAARRIVELLDGVVVLGYTADRCGRRRFTRALRRRLAALPDAAPVSAEPARA